MILGHRHKGRAAVHRALERNGGVVSRIDLRVGLGGGLQLSVFLEFVCAKDERASIYYGIHFGRARALAPVYAQPQAVYAPRGAKPALWHSGLSGA